MTECIKHYEIKLGKTKLFSRIQMPDQNEILFKQNIFYGVWGTPIQAIESEYYTNKNEYKELCILDEYNTYNIDHKKLCKLDKGESYTDTYKGHELLITCFEIYTPEDFPYEPFETLQERLNQRFTVHCSIYIEENNKKIGLRGKIATKNIFDEKTKKLGRAVDWDNSEISNKNGYKPSTLILQKVPTDKQGNCYIFQNEEDRINFRTITKWINSSDFENYLLSFDDDSMDIAGWPLHNIYRNKQITFVLHAVEF